MKNASLSAEMAKLRQQLPDLLGTLEAHPDWYGSIYVERKKSQTHLATLQQTQISDQFSLGAVLRIYDGYTLYEHALDQLDHTSLQKEAQLFVKKVKAHQPSTTSNQKLQKHLYQPPTWATRLQAQLDPVIASQIPNAVDAKTPVHFGISYQQDPFVFTSEQRLDQLKSIISRVQATALTSGPSAVELSYVMARESLSLEESLFIDRESNLSQTLYRISLTVIAMSGSNRSFARIGGLGGYEAITLEDTTLHELLKNLHDIKTAERLKPGRYQVLVGPVVAGVIAHEAFGHAQEGDTCARGRSKAWELYHTREKVGNEHATILNNPAVFKNGTESCAAWGSYFFDEEGWLAQSQVLLDQGVLKAPMTNFTSALRLNVPRTANGKRESWEHGVYTRQTNTYFSPGPHTLEQLMSKVQDGFLATEPAGGMEDPKGMGIQVGIQFLREIKNGQLTGRVFKGPAGGDIQLTGYVPDVLNSIVAKSKIEFNSTSPDQAQHPYNDVGGCGKYHKEFVYAGCGGTYMLLNDTILG
jgi:TldD protein